jgi:hypothetical protein
MKTRKTRPLDPQLDSELGTYVAAAGATASANHDLAAAAICAIGLGSLAIAPIANAEIVYTSANQSIGGNPNGASFLAIDLNNDGIVDLSVSAYNFVSFSSGDHLFRDTDAFAKPDNLILATTQGLAAADVPGQIIGPRGHFQRDGVMATSRFNGGTGNTFSSSKGQWLHAKNRYLGVKFLINGETHYGWARLNASAGSATLTGYAYETIPNRPIPAGAFETAPSESGANANEPARGKSRLASATLGMLARGAVGTGKTQTQTGGGF